MNTCRSGSGISPLIMPNLPTAAVRTVIMSGESPKLSEALAKLDIDVLYTGKNGLLEESISNHADMLVYHAGSDVLALSCEQKNLFDNLQKLQIKPVYLRALINSPYPFDALLNAARLGSFLICNLKTVAKEITDLAITQELEIVDVKQGYTKCSICIINENAIITEDIGIKTACEKRGIDVLLISKGSVKLRNHGYGFFGGCTGLIDKNKLAVTGNIKLHSDYKMLNEFLTKYGINVISLTDDELVDIGGIIPIMQKNSSTNQGEP
jgi:hypothetical protein